MNIVYVGEPISNKVTVRYNGISTYLEPTLYDIPNPEKQFAWGYECVRAENLSMSILCSHYNLGVYEIPFELAELFERDFIRVLSKNKSWSIPKHVIDMWLKIIKSMMKYNNGDLDIEYGGTKGEIEFEEKGGVISTRIVRNDNSYIS